VLRIRLKGHFIENEQVVIIAEKVLTSVLCRASLDCRPVAEREFRKGGAFKIVQQGFQNFRLSDQPNGGVERDVGLVLSNRSNHCPVAAAIIEASVAQAEHGMMNQLNRRDKALAPAVAGDEDILPFA
jgi:hypothetical protein